MADLRKIKQKYLHTLFLITNKRLIAKIDLLNRLALILM